MRRAICLDIGHFRHKDAPKHECELLFAIYNPVKTLSTGVMNSGSTMGVSTTGPRRQPVQQRSQETFQRIETAAQRLLAAGLSVSEITTPLIAREAGLSIGGLYRFFPDKSSIVDAIAIRLLAGFDDQVDAMIQDGPSFADGSALISDVIDMFVRYMDEHPAFKTIVYGDGYLSQNARQRYFGHLSRTAVLVRNYANKKLQSNVTSQLQLRWRIVGEISGPLIGMALKQENAEDRDKILNETKNLICNYLFSPNAPRR
jgi:AcrR family transcriptional regulator